MTPDCFHCSNPETSSESRKAVVCFGHFYRKSDQKKLQRYRCLSCRKTFSDASPNACFGQKKRQLNQTIFELLVSGVSQRRLALLLKINRKTVVRKFLFLGASAYEFLPKLNLLYPKTHTLEFDDLETFEHTKFKPLSVTIAVEYKSRRILGFRVAKMPAKGLLVKRALKKYGIRKDERKKKRNELFEEIKDFVKEGALIKSDENPHYIYDVKKHFPKSKHERFKGKRGCVVGQGELKGGGFDPLFSLNHTYAMFRANVNRLFRRTWNTTKIPERLGLHMAMYALYHNLKLIQN